MKATKVSVAVSRTINMGNFESLKLEETIEVELEMGDTSKDVLDKLRDHLDEKVESDGLLLARRIRGRK